MEPIPSNNDPDESSDDLPLILGITLIYVFIQILLSRVYVFNVMLMCTYYMQTTTK